MLRQVEIALGQVVFDEVFSPHELYFFRGLAPVEEREREGIETLPGSLIEAITLTEQSDLVREALGEHTFRNFIMSKQVEWDRYRVNVSEWELEEYLSVL